MKLYFLRHAEAEDGPVDARRALTRKGRRDSARLGRWLKSGGIRFDLAFTSPLVRARETAALVLDACPLARGRLVSTRQLLNATTPAGFGRWLKRASKGNPEAVLFVGHEPSLSAHVRRLLGVGQAGALPLSKGAVARVDTEDLETGTLKFLVGPKQIS